MLIIVTAPICPACDSAKKYLKEKGIKFRSVHFETPEGRMWSDRFRLYTAPLIIDPKQNKAITGFSKRRIDELIGGMDNAG